MSENNHHELPPGTLLHNRYRIVSVIGQGGFGITYKALDQTLSRPVCIKELFLSGHSTRGAGNTVQSQGLKDLDFEHFSERFIEEAGALARFRHPGIVQVLDVFRENGTAYSVMEYIKGQTLKDKIQREGRMPLPKALPLMQAVLDATEEVHRQGMLHRDIKPDNIMLREDGSPVLIDFGSARTLSDAKTITQTAILTPGYAPPEQYSEKARRGPFTDIYSLGATFYFMLTGVRPLPATDRQLETLQAPHRIQPEIPVTLSSALMLALNIKPEERFASIEQFRRAISPNTQPIGPVGPPRMRVNFYVVLGVLLILGLLGYGFWNTGPGSTKPQNGVTNNDSALPPADIITGHEKSVPPSPEESRSAEASKTGHEKSVPPSPEESSSAETSKTTEAAEPVKESAAPLNPILQRLLKNMVYVQGGSFTMGCTNEQGSDCFDDEKPAHTVQINSFYIGKYEITQEEWEAVMGSNPSHFSNCVKCPVENVSWYDVQAFINALNRLTGRQFRLPTEAEWEFAARSGNRSRSQKYSGSDNLVSVAWYNGNSGSRTHPVGQKAANALGLHDMSGNVWEWCSDWAEQNYYSKSPGNNPRGPGAGNYRMLRGGSWGRDARSCRVSNRHNFDTPIYHNYGIGFRLVSPSL
jgi:formylglycine-generating enzyme required for sulfatase activity